MSRPKREPVARTTPIRDVSMMFRPETARAEGGGGRADAARRRGPHASGDDGVSRGVDSAYRVLDEYLRRGRAAAESQAHGTLRGDFASRDPQDFARRAVRYWADMMSMWVDYIGPMVPGGDAFRRGPFNDPPEDPRGPERRGANPPPEPARNREPERVAVAVELASTRPAQVAVDLHAGAVGRRLAVQPLQALDGQAKPPLRDVKLGPGEGGGMVVVLAIGADQPAGTYLGAVFDAATGEARGTLRVVVR